MTGKQIWRVKHEYPPETLRVVCCGIVNRGAAIYEGMIIRALMDDRIDCARCQDRQGDLDGQIAGSGDTCQRLCHDRRAADRERRRDHRAWPAPNSAIAACSKDTMPRPASISGGLYTIPAKGEPGSETWEGDSQLTGGGSSWVTGTYDPELDLVYWGIGNPAPWNRARPQGRQSVHQLDLRHSAEDRRARLVLPDDAARPVRLRRGADADHRHHQCRRQPAQGRDAGQPQRLPLCARRQGRQAHCRQSLTARSTGRSGIDMETGRPNVTDVFTGALEGKNVTVWPSVSGVTNWQHMSFSPQTGMLYINTLHVGMTYEARRAAQRSCPARRPVPEPSSARPSYDDPNVRGFLKAVDPLTGKSKWETPYKSPNYSSTMVTASNLVFTGVMTGEFQALDADTGKILWSFQTPSGIVGQPVTWERNGKQYVTVMSGLGGVYAQRAGDPNLDNLPTGVSLWTFALFDK